MTVRCPFVTIWGIPFSNSRKRSNSLFVIGSSPIPKVAQQEGLRAPNPRVMQLPRSPAIMSVPPNPIATRPIARISPKQSCDWVCQYPTARIQIRRRIQRGPSNRATSAAGPARYATRRHATGAVHESTAPPACETIPLIVSALRGPISDDRRQSPVGSLVCSHSAGGDSKIQLCVLHVFHGGDI